MSSHFINNSEKLNTLYQAWKCGKAYWYKLTEWQYQDHMKKLEEDNGAGIPTKTARKQRSDTGGTHCKQKRSAAEDPQGHSTKCACKSSMKEHCSVNQNGPSVKRPYDKKKQVATEGDKEGANESSGKDKEDEDKDELDD
ncbi:hypothetical protein GYMLUDRAFT_60897 [Collybiopsis luxurians FD-317 M1]|uniref:No apical meristem-associated C-terminal domain-containing protein n=1 Tax=Collybiopsis luxurians FD-317 M1 TaxID=944289 RepID=A0A0D0CR75_9AGAR|nr:hypothetical protein GYMLUDRAFT_60897 [Collybiopsis luxurians FD-317 M1]